MSALRRLYALGLCVLSAACTELPARGQLLIYVDTDAPVPHADGPQRPIEEPAPLFDTLQIELFEPEQSTPCVGCSRELAIDDESLRSLQLSFGVLPEEERAGYRARVRLFSMKFRIGPEPYPDSTIDVTVRLPVVSEGEIAELTVFLPTDDVATPRGSLDDPVEPTRGRPEVSRVGSWHGAQRIPCNGVPAPDEACVPGGAYWMGNPRATVPSGPAAELSARSQRLVIVSPFFLDRTEVTVASLRAFGPNPLFMKSWSGSTAGTAYNDWCTYPMDPAMSTSEREAIAVNCVDWRLARDYCLSQGRQLPTEAQLEYVGGGLAFNHYPWGDDLPVCEDAVHLQGGYGILYSYIGFCRQEGAPGGPNRPGSGARDRLPLEGGAEVVDLVGNLSEWTSDAFQPTDGPCWPVGVVRDPRCDDSGNPNVSRTVKGGSWLARAASLKASSRYRQSADAASMHIGFRCARPAE